MKLDRVTLTGADDSVQPRDLARLSMIYPYVEWGILVSQSHGGEPRWPSMSWIADLQRTRKESAHEPAMNLSLHVCGQWVRSLLMGENKIPPALLEGFSRVQLNFHGEICSYQPGLFFEALPSLGERQIIFQIDGRNGARLLEDVWSRDTESEVDAVPLFDLSHGGGVLPGEWPSPMGRDVYNGYAGGLGPNGLAAQLDRIGKASKGCRVWVDMETRIRSDPVFDLEKCQLVLETAGWFVRNER